MVLRYFLMFSLTGQLRNMANESQHQVTARESCCMRFLLRKVGPQVKHFKCLHQSLENLENLVDCFWKRVISGLISSTARYTECEWKEMEDHNTKGCCPTKQVQLVHDIPIIREKTQYHLLFFSICTLSPITHTEVELDEDSKDQINKKLKRYGE